MHVWLCEPSFLALFLSFSAPVSESDCRLPVAWSLVVQGEESPREVPMFEGSSHPFRTLELSHTSFFPLPFPSELGPLLAPCEVVTGLAPGPVGAHSVFPRYGFSCQKQAYLLIWTSHWNKFT